MAAWQKMDHRNGSGTEGRVGIREKMKGLQQRRGVGPPAGLIRPWRDINIRHILLLMRCVTNFYLLNALVACQELDLLEQQLHIL